jgi:hypothetical protein
MPLELESAPRLAVSSSPELLRRADPLRKASCHRHRLCTWVDPLLKIVASPATSRCKPRGKPCSSDAHRRAPPPVAPPPPCHRRLCLHVLVTVRSRSNKSDPS